jgi:hypothetical protein
VLKLTRAPPAIENDSARDLVVRAKERLNAPAHDLLDFRG